MHVNLSSSETSFVDETQTCPEPGQLGGHSALGRLRSLTPVPTLTEGQASQLALSLGSHKEFWTNKSATLPQPTPLDSR